MVQHHIHYKEIDGYDETVWMTKSKHTKLHQRLRREGKCNISVEKLARISAYARYRTSIGKKYSQEYYQNNKERIIQHVKERWEKDALKRQLIREEYLKTHAAEIKRKKEIAKEKNRKWMQNYQKKYKEDHKEEIKKYQKEYRKRKKKEK